MPDKDYIGRQLSIADNPKYPDSLRVDALCRAISNSNLNGSKYPNPSELGLDTMKSYANICKAFVAGHIDLDAIESQAEELLMRNLGDFGE